jgi:acyl-CoA synthetase (AMP-forming)/AMP-acid ligase II
LTTEDIREHCAEVLAPYKVPTHVEFRTAPLPRNATGKVMKHVLVGSGSSGFENGNNDA